MQPRPPKSTLFPYTTLFRSIEIHKASFVLYSSRTAAMGGPEPVPFADKAAAESFAKDRKSTRLNSSHEWISYAVFCLKKKTIRKTRMVARALAQDQRRTGAI